jgi:hypothetical protein
MLLQMVQETSTTTTLRLSMRVGENMSPGQKEKIVKQNQRIKEKNTARDETRLESCCRLPPLLPLLSLHLLCISFLFRVTVTEAARCCYNLAII